MKAEIVVTMNREEVQRNIPYAMICETREGARWCGNKLSRRYESEFTPHEREECEYLFTLSHKWHLKTGVPDFVKMTASTMALWNKLGEFCATV